MATATKSATRDEEAIRSRTDEFVAAWNQHNPPEQLDFVLSSRPLFITAFDVPNNATRTHMQDIVKHIPVADAKWLGKLLGPLSDEQIRDCFRAAGYSPEDVESNAAMVKERIRALNCSSSKKQVYACGLVILLALSIPGCANRAPQVEASSSAATISAPASVPFRSGGLRRDQDSIASLNLFYGPGGKEHQPAGPFTFIKEDKEGTSPKFEIVDRQGVHWKVKLGEETKSETAATRLVWAAGYFTDEDYYLPKVRVAKLPKLDRGNQFVSKGGVVRGVRLERKLTGQKKIENWSWFKNPFIGTKELDGLKIMMALMNNWDLKEVNNAIYEEQGAEPRYVVSDLGATFGRTGNPLVRSKNNLRDYRRTKFIQKVRPEEVDFFLSSRPFFPTAIDVPNYVARTKMQSVAKHISRTHAKWLGQLLGQLSAEQIRDCFRAAGYSPQEVAGFAKVVQGRIADLNRL